MDDIQPKQSSHSYPNESKGVSKPLLAPLELYPCKAYSFMMERMLRRGTQKGRYNECERYSSVQPRISHMASFWFSSSTSMPRPRHTSSTISTTLRNEVAAPRVWVNRATQRFARRPPLRIAKISIIIETGLILRSKEKHN